MFPCEFLPRNHLFDYTLKLLSVTTTIVDKLRFRTISVQKIDLLLKRGKTENRFRVT